MTGLGHLSIIMKIIQGGVKFGWIKPVGSKILFLVVKGCSGPVDHFGRIIQKAPLGTLVFFGWHLLASPLLCPHHVLEKKNQQQRNNQKPNFHFSLLLQWLWPLNSISLFPLRDPS